MNNPKTFMSKMKDEIFDRTLKSSNNIDSALKGGINIIKDNVSLGKGIKLEIGQIGRRPRIGKAGLSKPYKR